MYVVTTWAQSLHAIDHPPITRCGKRYYSNAYEITALPERIHARDICIYGCFINCPFCQARIPNGRLMQRHIATSHVSVLEHARA